jgi:hypothetical protein
MCLAVSFATKLEQRRTTVLGSTFPMTNDYDRCNLSGAGNAGVYSGLATAPFRGVAGLAAP